MSKSKTSMLANIANRKSVRSYSDPIIKSTTIDELLKYVEKNSTGPYGNTTMFQIVDAHNFDTQALKSLGTYGVIRGAKRYLVGVTNSAPYSMEDFGYCMESAMLKATELGLGTCWLGGFLNRSTFADLCKISGDEIIPAVTPLGIAAKRTTLRDKMIRKVVKADNRVSFSSLFFLNDFTQELSYDVSNAFHKLLECVRIAPSASNKQPWKIILNSNTLHLYLDEDQPYNRKYDPVLIQNIDMGIAMAHVDLAAGELGLSGKWTTVKSAPKHESYQYISSWIN